MMREEFIHVEKLLAERCHAAMVRRLAVHGEEPPFPGPVGYAVAAHIKYPIPSIFDPWLTMIESQWVFAYSGRDAKEVHGWAHSAVGELAALRHERGIQNPNSSDDGGIFYIYKYDAITSEWREELNA